MIDLVYMFADAALGLTAFGDVAMIYHWLGVVEQDDFIAFISPDNYTAQLLMVHFFILEYNIAHAAFGVTLASFTYRKNMNLIWCERLFDSLPKKYKEHARWPMEYARLVVLRDQSSG